MTRQRSRDQSIEQLLRRSHLADSGAPVSDSCLDAETVAAWIDGGLDDRALAMAETHAAHCARCQALVGAMVRSAPEITVPVPWWRNWRLSWLVPLTAGAAAATLWMVVPDERPVSQPQEQSASQVRAVTPELRAATPAPAPAALQPPAQLQRQSDALGKERRNLPGTSAAVEAPRATREAADSAQLADRNVPKREAPSAPVLGEITVTAESIAPSPPAQLCGPAWGTVSTGIAAELTAGSSPSSSVCWVVGREGIVLLTTDRRRWQRVPFPEPVDLSSVQAVDARTATVVTADGRTFRTSDAGKTWIQGSPQDFQPPPF